MRRTTKALGASAAITALVVGSVLVTHQVDQPTARANAPATTVSATPPATSCSSGPAKTTPAPGVRFDLVAAAQIASSPRCTVDVPVLWAHGYAGHTLADLTFLDGQERLRGAVGSAVATTDFSEPICRAPAGFVRVYWRSIAGSGFNVPRGSLMPWDATCRISGGSDGNVGVVDAQGHEWDTWVVSSPSDQVFPARAQLSCSLDLNNSFTRSWFAPAGLPPGTPGFNPNSDLCSALVIQVVNSHGQPVDVRTFLGNSPGSSGGGVIASNDVVSPAEISAAKAAGRSDLGHALKMAIANTQPGPVCPSTIALTDPRIGVSCGVAVAPAGKVEGIANTNVGALPNTIPEGTRLQLVMTDAQVTAWLDAHAATEPLRSSMRLIVNTLRVEGTSITDTSAGPASIIADGTDPAAWTALGIPVDGSVHALQGLFTATNFRVLEPPVNHCSSGTTSTYACQADVSVYAA